MGWTIPRVKPPKDPPPCECPLCMDFKNMLERERLESKKMPGDDE